MIQFNCLECGMKFQVKDEFAGRSTTCPTCKSPLKVPEPSRTDAPLPAASISGAASSLEKAGANPSVTVAYQGNQDTSITDLLARNGSAEGRYLIDKEIARGGMGAVLRGVDRDIRREVAIKFMLDDRAGKHQMRFVEEAQITGQLEHPNIVPIHELGVDANKRLYFTMKMVRGRSLAQILETLKNEPAAAKDWSLGRLLLILVNVCHGLGYAHACQVIHRDLKPGNIMVGDFGEVSVMDWGLAKVLSDAVAKSVSTSRDEEGPLTQEGAVLGTPAYMPREQALGRIQEIDQRSDIYSLGAILYAMLTLLPPVEKGGGHAAVLLRVVQGEIKRPEERTPVRTIPPELSAIAMKALAREPKDRYQTVESFRRDVELYLEGRSVSAKHDTMRELAIKLVKRNKGVSLATGAALLMLVVVAAFFLKINYNARVRAETALTKADENYAAYLKEQEQRVKQGRDSIPSLLTAARLLVEKRDFDAARVQVRVALDFDPEHTELRKLRGQLALVGQDFAQAQTDLEAYARQHPKDLLTRELLAWLPRARANDTNSQVVLAEILTRHLAFALADGALLALGENAQVARQKLLTLYQQRIDKAWPGQGTRLTLKNASFHLSFYNFKQLTSLSPLRGLPLSSLDLTYCRQVEDLEPLKGMPLTSLILNTCEQVRDLEPLRGMPLTSLDLAVCGLVRDLEPLKGMPLTSLDLTRCLLVQDLRPLKGMPLASLNLTGCFLVRDLGALKGMPLQTLIIVSCYEVRDLKPLTGMPLTDLNLGGGSYRMKINDLSPLQGLPLKKLNLINCEVRDLAPLKGMPLTWLDLSGCSQLSNLGPLKNMLLTSLNLNGCPLVRDLGPLQGMPLTSLNLCKCPLVRDLGPLQGLPLQSLQIIGSGVTDLTPLQGMKLKDIRLTPKSITQGLDILRGMESLETIGIVSHAAWPAAEFWQKHKAGEFN